MDISILTSQHRRRGDLHCRHSDQLYAGDQLPSAGMASAADCTGYSAQGIDSVIALQCAAAHWMRQKFVKGSRQSLNDDMQASLQGHSAPRVPGPHASPGKALSRFGQQNTSRGMDLSAMMMSERSPRLSLQLTCISHRCICIAGDWAARFQ